MGDETSNARSPLGSTAAPAGGAENLQRLLRMLANHGTFEERFAPASSASSGCFERRYSLTEVRKTLVTDA